MWNGQGLIRAAPHDGGAHDANTGNSEAVLFHQRESQRQREYDVITTWQNLLSELRCVSTKVMLQHIGVIGVAFTRAGAAQTPKKWRTRALLIDS